MQPLPGTHCSFPFLTKLPHSSSSRKPPWIPSSILTSTIAPTPLFTFWCSEDTKNSLMTEVTLIVFYIPALS